MPQCSAVDLVYHLFDYSCIGPIAVFRAVLFFFYLLLCAKKNVFIRIDD